MKSLKLIGLALGASLALSTTALAQDISIAVAGLVSLMITWWSSPLDRLTSAERDELRRLRREIRMLREDATLAAQGAL